MITGIVEPVTSLKNARIGYKNLLVGASDASVSKAITPNTYERYVSGSGTTTIKFQLATSSTVDFIALAAHTFGTHNSGGTSVGIKYATSIGGALTTIETRAVTTDEAFMLLFDDIAVAEIALTFGAVAGLEIGVVSCGKSLEMERMIYGGHSPIDLSAKTEYQSTTSDTGNFLGRTVTRQGIESGYSWSNLSPVWYRSHFQPFVESATTTPFFLRWRPDAYAATVYGYTTNDISPSNMSGGSGLMSVNFNVRGYA